MRVKSKFEKYYLPADTKVTLMQGDNDLRPISLTLPKPPPLHLIEGYGLPPAEQRFNRLVIPHRLVSLESEALEKTKEDISTNKNNVLTLIRIQKKFWELLSERHKELKKEIDFIRKVWWMRLNGMWVFILGKPTWITGRHFYFLNFFEMDTKTRKPDYRDCDRREYVFKEYCWTSTESFKSVDEFGYAIANDDGSYDMEDLGRRICFGEGQPKNRRRGNTSKAISDMIEVVTRTVGSDGGGIQSYTEKSAMLHFSGKVMPAWNSIPIWLKPFSTSGRTSDVLKLDVAKNDYEEVGLSTQIDYAHTSSSKAFDGQKRAFLLTDEEGKTNICSVSERWSVNKHTLAQGDGMVIHGYASHPSTSDQLTDGSGDYEFLMSSSDFYKRIASKGQTPSGLFRIFIPAQDGLEGFIDSYGYSITGELKDYQKKEGKKQTAEAFLQGESDLLLKENTPESMKKYREHKQLYPMRYSDCFMGTAGQIGFDIEKIDARISVLRRENNTIKGNLKWVNDEFGGDVEFKEDDEFGRFTISKMPPDEVMNKKVKVPFYNSYTQKQEESYMPMYPDMFTAGADPFRTSGKAEKKVGESIGKGRGSDGGLAILWNYDEGLDGNKPKDEWDSYKFVLTYRYRQPNSDGFNEDCLMSCIFFGAMMFPEVNVVNTYEYFLNHGFGAYLIYDTDKYTGKLKDKPGMDTGTRNKNDLFDLWRDYVDYRIHKEDHVAMCHELKDIKGLEYMRFFDLFTAGGMALMGAKSAYAKMMKRLDSHNNDYDLENFI